jgi:hypothetical protein
MFLHFFESAILMGGPPTHSEAHVKTEHIREHCRVLMAGEAGEDGPTKVG